MKVLIVDQDRETVQKLGGMIRELGHEVLNKPSETCLSEDGLAYDSTVRPDLVFLDVDATLLKGIDAIEPFKMTNPKAKILLTTQGAIEDIPSCDHALGIFSKPIREESMRRLLRHVETVYFSRPDSAILPAIQPVNRVKKHLKESAWRSFHTVSGQVRLVVLQALVVAALVAVAVQIGF